MSITKNGISIEENGHYLFVRFEYKESTALTVKKIWPYKWDREKKAWVYPLSMRRDVYRLFNVPMPMNKQKKRFRYKGKPSDFLMSHQLRALILAEENPKYCLFHETGTGKSVTSIEILKHKQVKSIIVAPLSTLRAVWEDTFQSFYPDIPYINLYPFKKNTRDAIIRNSKEIHIINYDGFKRHFDTIMKAGYKCLILDESSCLKGQTTQIAKKLIEFGQSVPSAYLLSGTPAPNSKLEYNPQIELVAPGHLGLDYASFRKRYFNPVRLLNGTLKWEENISEQGDFRDRLKKFCMFVSKKDVLDLPGSVHELRDVIMTPEQSRIYKEMKRNLKTEVANEKVVSPNVLSKISKLRQITSGFLYNIGSTIKFSNAKLLVLKEVLSEIGNNQVLIWANYKEEIIQIRNELPGARAIFGDGKKQSIKDEDIKAFKNNEYQYLILNPASLKYGITFVNASYAVYYSLSFSNESWQQSQDRIYRYGQHNKCTYIILNCAGTIDDVIFNVLQKKERLDKEIFNHLRS